MNSKRTLAPMFLSLFLIAAWTSPARASLTWDFGFDSFEEGFGGTGSFTLTEDGFDVEDFSFGGTCGGNACTFFEIDVFFVEADLNEDWTFNSLQIEASLVDSLSLYQAEIALFEDRLILTCQSLQEEGSQTNCNGGEFDSRRELIGSGAFLTPVHTSVPVPATLLLFGLGLAGIGFGLRRR